MRWIKFAAAGVLLAVVLAGLSRISFNIRILELLPDRLEQVRGLSVFLRHFSLPKELVLTVESPDPAVADERAHALAEHLAARPDLVARAVADPPWEKDPADLAEFLAYLLVNRPPGQLAEAVARLSPERAPEVAAGARDRLAETIDPQEIAMLGYDPFGLSGALASTGLMSQQTRSEFSSADGTFRVIYVEAAPPLANYKEAIAWTGKIKALAREWNAAGDVRLGFTGEPSFVADISGTMEWDMMSSGAVTLLVIGAIFWVCYRRTKPLLDLMAMLVLTFVISLGIAGLFLKELTVMGVGFASIMVGLSVDYGYLIYQKSVGFKGTLRELRWDAFRNIGWTAGTTAAAFFVLNRSSLPGLSQLGNLVGIGVLVGGAVMLFLFAPISLKWDQPKKAGDSFPERLLRRPGFAEAGFWVTAAFLAACVAALLVKGLPAFDATSRSLRPRVSEAYDSLDRLQEKMIDTSGLLSLVVSGKDEAEVAARLERAETILRAAVERGDAERFTSTKALWPTPENQRRNLPLVAGLAADAGRLERTLLDAGFTPDSFVLTRRVLEHWASWAGRPVPLWPGGESSRWIFRRTASRADGLCASLGIVHPVPGREDALADAVSGEGSYLVSWQQMGRELKRTIPGEFGGLMAGLVGVVLAILLVGFRGLRDVVLLVVTMALVFLALLGTMAMLGMRWDFFNLAALLLLLGTGIDYSILLLLELRRNGGNVPEAQRVIGMVVILCALSGVAGFGTISWAGNYGLASLGRTCALGLFLDAAISLFVLPKLWLLSRGRPLFGVAAAPGVRPS
jgi:predicted RND superfamily exporter protein